MRILKFVLIFILIISSFLTVGASFAYFLMPKLQQDVEILVLGKGGEGHTAPDLTDTIMVLHLNYNAKKASILSLPRDIWIPEIRAKLNSAYHYGGFKMAKESVQSITGQPINYTLVVDFSLFKDLIDIVGGVDVDVENEFTDDRYPIEGRENDLCNGDRLYKCRYESITFKQGLQKMNGELTLKFVRSRNAEGDEGTDIAREKRQQKVIYAVKQKFLSKSVILKPSVLKSLYEVLVSHLETDIDKDTATALIRFLIESRDNINFLNLPEEITMVSQGEKKYDNQYVFIPRSGSWKEIQEWITSQPTQTY